MGHGKILDDVARERLLLASRRIRAAHDLAMGV
jgi:hypothetical protein